MSFAGTSLPSTKSEVSHSAGSQQVHQLPHKSLDWYLASEVMRNLILATVRQNSSSPMNQQTQTPHIHYITTNYISACKSLLDNNKN